MSRYPTANWWQEVRMMIDKPGYGHACSFKELEVYRISEDISRKIFARSKEFPKEERYALTDQIRRASRSVGAQIAESWAKRKYRKHFISKLSDADAEQMETQHWVQQAFQCGYLCEESAKEILAELERLGRMLNSMMKKAGEFCRSDDGSISERSTYYGHPSKSASKGAIGSGLAELR